MADDPRIRMLDAPGKLDFLHSRTVELPRAVTALEAWAMMTAGQPRWLGAAFRLRDAISARFGVKRIGSFSGKPVASVAAGDHLDFFLVEEAAPDLLVLTERDRHLDVMTCLSVAGRRLTVTASVVTHNAFGRAYMLPVAPAHRLLVASMLRKLRRRMAREAGTVPAR
ncbi:DUF2867 domain-containing protein [Poseidonocella sp. HB161398]|uniref:DUF2867 domain-containing protein n=1 Tax=Poseidonocella sp. HB161398 TaxID=2320855 RepID=UPI001109227E|nr:DUF2867 domain-containing protein [Poseidonocella sp. HB161398]